MQNYTKTTLTVYTCNHRINFNIMHKNEFIYALIQKKKKASKHDSHKGNFLLNNHN